MRIAIRADGSQKIGMGHIMRTMVLAKELARSNDIFFVCDYSKMKNTIGEKYIRESGFEICYINNNRDFEGIKSCKADILIIDSYEVDEEYFSTIRNMFGAICYIDDLNKHYYDVDILISHILNSEFLPYRVPSNTKLLLGTNYALIREEFKTGYKKDIGQVKNIMLTVGGANIHNITEKLLELVDDTDYCYHIVIGPYFDQESINRIRCYESSHIVLHYNPMMHELMQSCDLAITACGGSVYELACSGIPIIGMILSENQEYVCKTMEQLGLIKSIGWYNNITGELLNNAVKDMSDDISLRTEMSLKLQELIDGKGPERIAKVINSIELKQE